MNLREIKIGQTVRITAVGSQGALRQHFLDMGVIPGAEVTLMKFAPLGDPMELRIHGYELTLRLADAANITVEEIAESREVKKADTFSTARTAHPGLGEEGKFHPKGSGNKLPDDEILAEKMIDYLKKNESVVVEEVGDHE